MSRLRRKDVKRDEVLESVGSAVEYVRDHTRIVLVAIAAVVLAVVVVAVLLQVRKGRSIRANEALARAITLFEAPIDATAPQPDDPDQPAFADEAKRRARAREALAGVRSGFGGSDPADIAAVYLAELAAEEGDLAAARELWEEFLKRQGDHLLAAQVRLNLMALDRTEGRGEELAARLEAMLEEGAGNLPEELLLHELARTLEKIGRPEEARDAYLRLVEEHPSSPFSAAAQRQAEALDQQLEG